MFLELVATITAGVGAGGLVLLIAKASRGRIPRWLVPVAAGLSMIGFTIWSEYSWYGRTSDGLPDGVEVAWTNEEAVFYRPWTYLIPHTNRFLAVDTATARTNPDQPGQRMVDLYLMGRWTANRRVTVVFDCRGNRRADLMEGAEIGAAGALEGVAWVDMPADDPVLLTACERRTS